MVYVSLEEQKAEFSLASKRNKELSQITWLWHEAVFMSEKPRQHIDWGL